MMILIPFVDILGMLLASLLPSVQSARESGRYATCANNLKRIASAMQRYYQTHGCFPPAFIPDETGKPKHSWRVLILPYLGESEVYARYDFDEPWNSLRNMAFANQMPRLYRCPSDPSADRSLTSYAMVVGPQAVSDGPTSRRLSDIGDGIMNTIMVVENVNAEFNWLEPRDLNTKDMAFRVNAFRGSPREAGTAISSRHPGLANVLFCDGTVRLIAETMDEKAVKALLTIDGGEAITARDLDP
jgi:prepilin-type processing-associated H-X9-DG protein